MKNFISSLVSISMALLLCLLISTLLGESPLKIIQVLYQACFGSAQNFQYTLFYATPLIFTGLSVAMAFHAGLFNIGSEGQLYMGSLALTWLCLKFTSLQTPSSYVLASLAGFLGAGLWGLIVGFLKSKRGAHEVIVTIMLNFISYAVVGYFILGPLKNPESQNPESAEIASSFQLHKFSEHTPLNTSLFLAVICIIITWILLFKTSWGYEVRMIGTSKETARRSGIPISKRIMQAMFISGGLSGLVAVNEILGHAHKFKDQFSSGLGFIGIAVALLARNNPFGIIFSALLFGALSKGSLDLELETEKITRDLALVIQGMMILFVASQGYWSQLLKKWRRK